MPSVRLFFRKIFDSHGQRCSTPSLSSPDAAHRTVAPASCFWHHMEKKNGGTAHTWDVLTDRNEILESVTTILEDGVDNNNLGLSTLRERLTLASPTVACCVARWVVKCRWSKLGTPLVPSLPPSFFYKKENAMHTMRSASPTANTGRKNKLEPMRQKHRRGRANTVRDRASPTQQKEDTVVHTGSKSKWSSHVSSR